MKKVLLIFTSVILFSTIAFADFVEIGGSGIDSTFLPYDGG